MEAEEAAQVAGKTIESALTEFGPIAFKEGVIPTNWVSVIEWYREDGSRVLSVMRSEDVTPWLASGMISFAQQVDEVDYLIAGYGADLEEED